MQISLQSTDSFDQRYPIISVKYSYNFKLSLIWYHLPKLEILWCIEEKLHHFCNTTFPDDGTRLGRKYLENN